jgi:UDP-glucose 4-epimerase
VAVLRAVDDVEIGHLIHAAGVTPWSPKVDYTDDVTMARSVAAIANAHAVPRVTFLSGWNVYDMARGSAPFSEDARLGGVGAYGRSKLAVERYLAEYLASSKLTVLRLSSIFGPGQLSPGLIPNAVHSASRKGVIRINSVQTRRDYLYIDDVVDAVRRLTRLDAPADQVLNIGSGESVSVRDVAETIKRIFLQVLDRSVHVEQAGNVRETDPRNNILDIRRARMLGLLAEPTPFLTGLQRYILWSASRR